MTVARVHLVVPAEVDDPSRPSGGNVYDLELAHSLAAAGWRVHRHRVVTAGRSPERRADDLGAVLAGLPDGAVVVVDGLLMTGAEEAVVTAGDRLRVVPLLHLPASFEDPRDGALAAEHRLLAAAAAVLTTSGWSRDGLAARHPDLRERVHVARPGVRPAPPADHGPGGTALTCVAALRPAKGQDVLVAALARLGDLDWTCRLVGPLDADPAFVARLRDAVRAGGLEGRVRLTGPAPRAGVDAALAATDLLVLPTRLEVYGMVVTEALARGVPVVASDVGGVPEALGRTPTGEVPGVLVPPADPVALAGALRAWLTDAPLRARLRRAAVSRRERLTDWSATAASVEAVLRRLPETAARSRPSHLPVNRPARASVVSG